MKIELKKAMVLLEKYECMCDMVGCFDEIYLYGGCECCPLMQQLYYDEYGEFK